LSISAEEARATRENKYREADGSDVRKFSNTSDPYYHKKQIPTSVVHEMGIGKVDLTPVEQYEAKERKLSMFKLDGDPLSEITGRRASLAAQDHGDYEASAIGPGRRRSSAVAPHLMGKGGAAQGSQLEPIISRNEPAPEFTTDHFEKKPSEISSAPRTNELNGTTTMHGPTTTTTTTTTTTDPTSNTSGAPQLPPQNLHGYDDCDVGPRDLADPHSLVHGKVTQT